MLIRSITVLNCLLVVTQAYGQASPPLAIGDVAPDWKQLKSSDGKLISLSDFAETEVLVLCFTCNSCPYSVDYEDRMVAFQKKFADKSKVALIAINSNSIPADNLEQMKVRAEAKEFNFPYLKDETQDIARAYGAVYTPEFFVLNRDRKLIYKGAMDDATRADAVKVNHVEAAVTAALAGQVPSVATTGARGCAIRFKRRRR